MIMNLLKSAGITQYVVAGLGITVLFLAGMGYWYYKDSQATIEILNQNISTLKADNSNLKSEIKSQNKSIQSIIAENKKNNELTDELNKEMKKISEQSKKLSKLLAEHNLNKLANKKPGLIERRVNDATKQTIQDFESFGNYNTD